MPIRLSRQAIDALNDVSRGGPGDMGGGQTPIGFYRSGPQLEKFMRSCNVDFQVIGSRVPSLVNCLNEVNNRPDADTLLPRIIEAAADPRDFSNNPGKHQAVIEHLNSVLVYGGLELQRQGMKVRLVAVGRSTPVIDQLARKAEAINFVRCSGIWPALLIVPKKTRKMR